MNKLIKKKWIHVVRGVEGQKILEYNLGNGRTLKNPDFSAANDTAIVLEISGELVGKL